MSHLRKKNGSWHYVNGGKSLKIPATTKAQANKIKEKLDAKAFLEGLGFMDLEKINFYDLCEKYIQYIKLYRDSSSYKSEVNRVNKLKRYLKNVELSQIKYEDIEKIKSAELNRGLQKVSINRDLDVLSSMFSKAKEWNHLYVLPKIDHFKVKGTPPQFLKESEIQLLNDTGTPYSKIIIDLFINTGVRIPELKRMKLADVNMELNTITVLNAKNMKRKSGELDYRVIPIDESLYDTMSFLMEYIIDPRSQRVIRRKQKHMEYLICHPDGSPIKTGFRKVFALACKRAGLPYRDPKILRHTFASHLVMAGVDLRAVQELMGHSSILTTMIYAHLTPKHIESSVGKLPWNKKSNGKILAINGSCNKNEYKSELIPLVKSLVGDFRPLIKYE